MTATTAPAMTSATAPSTSAITRLTPPRANDHSRASDDTRCAPLRASFTPMRPSGTVYVSAAPLRRAQAACTCSWRGRRRLIRDIAVLDALTHAAKTGCQPANPLIWPASRPFNHTAPGRPSGRNQPRTQPRATQLSQTSALLTEAYKRYDNPSNRRFYAPDLAHMGRMGPCP